MAGMIDLIRRGGIRKNEMVVYSRAGGAVGLFDYRGTFDAAA